MIKKRVISCCSPNLFRGLNLILNIIKLTGKRSHFYTASNNENNNTVNTEAFRLSTGVFRLSTFIFPRHFKVLYGIIYRTTRNSTNHQIFRIYWIWWQDMVKSLILKAHHSYITHLNLKWNAYTFLSWDLAIHLNPDLLSAISLDYFMSATWLVVYFYNLGWTRMNK